MAADIITPRQFAKTEAAPEAAPEAEHAPLVFEELPLGEVAYGEELIGTLTEDETALFLEYYDASQDAQSLDREIGGDMMMNVGRDMKAGKITEQGYQTEKLLEPETVRTFYRAIALAARLKGVLFWQIGERLNCHDWSVAVRTKRRIVKVRRKW